MLVHCCQVEGKQRKQAYWHGVQQGTCRWSQKLDEQIPGSELWIKILNTWLKHAKNLWEHSSGCCPDRTKPSCFVFSERVQHGQVMSSQEGTFVDHSKRAVSYEDFVQGLAQSRNQHFRRLPSRSSSSFTSNSTSMQWRVRWTKSWFSFLAMILGMQQLILGYMWYACQFLCMIRSDVGPFLWSLLSRAFWYMFWNRWRTWCEASRRWWMVWSRRSGRCLEMCGQLGSVRWALNHPIPCIV